MSVRIVILDVLDPAGEQGLSVAVQAAYEAGADDVVPVPTASLTDAGDLAPAEARNVGQALGLALEHGANALLVGRLPNTKVAAAVTSVLAQSLPETFVFAPGPYVAPRNWFPGNAARQQRQHFQTLNREATVVLMSTDEVSAWFDTRDLDTAAAGEHLCEAGAYSAWIRDARGAVRALDRLVTGDRHAVLDYPSIPEDQPDRAPGALAALLGRGLTLHEAVVEAQRHASCPAGADAVACR